MRYLGSVVDVVFPQGDSAASDPPEGLAEGFLNALDSGQRTFHGQLVTGVQGTSTDEREDGEGLPVQNIQRH